MSGVVSGVVSVVVLAEVGSQVWLVQGDEHVDALMYNRLPADVTVEWVTCGTRMEAFRLWQEHSDSADPDGMPWMINPQIADRIRATTGRLERSLRFSPWSAMLDDVAQRELAGAAEWLAANPGGHLVLRSFALAAPAPGLEDLQRLRVQLAVGALSRAGVAAGSVREEAGDAATDADAERIEIVTRPPGSGG